MRKGTFQQSEFAADLSEVLTSKAPPAYQHAVQLVCRTFITEGMGHLLTTFAQRLLGHSDPVLQLQTAFGGGKTHTMLAVYHLVPETIGGHLRLPPRRAERSGDEPNGVEMKREQRGHRVVASREGATSGLGQRDVQDQAAPQAPRQLTGVSDGGVLADHAVEHLADLITQESHRRAT